MTALITEQITHEGETLSAVLDRKAEVSVSASTTWDPPSIAAAGTYSQEFTVTGAQMGDFVHISLSQNLAGCVLSGYVNDAGKVTAVLTNPTGSSVNIASGTLRFRLTREVVILS